LKQWKMRTCWKPKGMSLNPWDSSKVNLTVLQDAGRIWYEKSSVRPDSQTQTTKEVREGRPNSEVLLRRGLDGVTDGEYEIKFCAESFLRYPFV
jgi:hypothetical protein